MSWLLHILIEALRELSACATALLDEIIPHRRARRDVELGIDRAKRAAERAVEASLKEREGKR